MTWYTGDPTYDTLLSLVYVVMALTIVGASFIQTPYGRFASDSQDASLAPRLGWFLMELPAAVFFLYFYFQGPNAFEPSPLFILFMWVVHYANRGWIMPALMRAPKGLKSSFRMMVVIIGGVVTSLHGYLNAVWASTYQVHSLLCYDLAVVPPEPWAENGPRTAPPASRDIKPVIARMNCCHLGF